MNRNRRFARDSKPRCAGRRSLLISKTMPPPGHPDGGSRRVRFCRGTGWSVRRRRSAGVLRDQQTLDQTTGNHGHLLL